MQTKNLLSDLNQTITNGLPILDGHRVKVEKISVNLRNALNQSRDRSVLPTDLETTANFVEIVAKWIIAWLYHENDDATEDHNRVQIIAK